MTGPIMRMFQTTTHAFNRQPIGPAKRKGETRATTAFGALAHISGSITREQLSRLAASTLSRCLSRPRPKYIGNYTLHANVFRQNVSHIAE